MYIEDYIAQIQTVLSSYPFVSMFTLEWDKRDTYEGFLRAEIQFTDGSVLRVREFVSVEDAVERDMYAYQYTDAANNLYFRYDNTPHHRKLNLPTFPHHKHDGREDNVVASIAPSLGEVLQEIIDRLDNLSQ